jgi:lysophospholipase L1-like esterase
MACAVVIFALCTGLGCSTAPDDARGERGGDPGTEAPGDAPERPAPPPAASSSVGPSALAPPGRDDSVALVHVVGRVDRRDPAGPRFGWPGTEIRARFSGTGLALRLADTGASHYDVAVDGGTPTVLVVSGPARLYEVARDLAPGLHDVVVTKRTETVVGITQLLDVVPAPGGALVPSPAWSSRRIEIVGDSIACGYGVLGTEATCHFSPATEAEPRAWGALTARALSAMHTTIAFSGLGVWRNFDGDTEDTMPMRYARALANDPASTWDRSFVPDVVVVSLGTNDFTGGKGDPGSAFEPAYLALLTEIRATHPTAHIVTLNSPMLSEPSRSILRAYVEGAIATRAAAGDAKVTYLDVDEQREADGYGCDFHPSAITQQRMAAALTAHVKALTGW